MLFKSKRIKELENELAIARDDVKKFTNLYHDYRDRANFLRGELDNSRLINSQLRDEIEELNKQIDEANRLIAKSITLVAMSRAIVEKHEKHQKTITELDFPNT